MAGEGGHQDTLIYKAANSSTAVIWSRLIQMVFVPLASIFALFAWNTLLEVRDFVVANQSDIRILQQRVSTLEKDAGEIKTTRYTSNDALRDFRLRDQINVEQDRRIDNLEERIGGGRP